jgi:1-acyl-sn-glycerol-3-phosphate acyltransferase
MISSLVLLATFIILGAPSAVIFIPWSILTGNVLPLYNVTLMIVRTGYFLAGIRIEVQGRDRVPANTACIFMANHVSNLDPPALIPNVPGRTTAFMKRGLMKIPVLGWAFKQGELIPVDRDGRRESAERSIEEARRLLAKGVHITTFVEGTRSKDGRLLPFKKGPFYLAMAAGAPCIPVSIWGTETLMAKGSMRIQPGTAHITFHAPIYPSDYKTRESLMRAVRAAITSGLPEWMHK